MPRENAMFINQDAEIYRFTLDINRYFYLARAADHHKAYIHVVEGELDICDGTDTISISAGDGVMCSDIERLEFIKTSEQIAEGMLFVLPGYY
jgi:redox-sensitive bicupin YhaK (pirin superfamily)